MLDLVSEGERWSEIGRLAFDRNAFEEAYHAWMQGVGYDNPLAMNGLGFLYSDGLGVEQNSETAEYWFSRARVANHFFTAVEGQRGALWRGRLRIEFSACALFDSIRSGSSLPVLSFSEKRPFWDEEIIEALQVQMARAGAYEGRATGRINDAFVSSVRGLQGVGIDDPCLAPSLP